MAYYKRLRGQERRARHARPRQRFEGSPLRERSMLIIINDPTANLATPAAPPALPTVSANRRWLKEHMGQYKDQWLALRDGALLGASPSLDTLLEQVSREHGVTFPSREVMITTGY
jgi:hypothetical protein